MRSYRAFRLFAGLCLVAPSVGAVHRLSERRPSATGRGKLTLVGGIGREAGNV